MARMLSAARWPSCSVFSHRSSRACATTSRSRRADGSSTATAAPHTMPASPNSSGLRAMPSVSRRPARHARPPGWVIFSVCSPAHSNAASPAGSGAAGRSPRPGAVPAEETGVFGDEPSDAKADQRQRRRIGAKCAAEPHPAQPICAPRSLDHVRCLFDQMFRGEFDRQRVQSKIELDPSSADFVFDLDHRPARGRPHHRRSLIQVSSWRSELKLRRGTSDSGSSHLLPR